MLKIPKQLVRMAGTGPIRLAASSPSSYHLALYAPALGNYLWFPKRAVTEHYIFINANFPIFNFFQMV